MPKQTLAARGKRRRRDDGERSAPARDLTTAEQGLFEALRQLRRTIAKELAVPPFVVFSDATLDELARLRPTTPAGFLRVKGVGQKKLESFGERFLAAIAQYGDKNGMAAAAPVATAPREPVMVPEDGPVRAAARAEAAALFRAGTGIDECVSQIGRAMSTVVGYLVEWIAEEHPASIAPWVSPALQARVEQAMHGSEDGRLKPVFEALGGEVPYEVIRIVSAHLRSSAAGG
jgi:ATP-dependent DNA helicase RecQ